MNPPHVISDFFDSPELLDIQRTGFYNFLKEGIPQLLAKEFPIKVRNGNYSVELSLNEKTVKLIAPEDDPRDCILKMKTYNCKLYAQVNILCKKYSSTPYKYKSCCKSYTNQRFVRHLGFGAKSNRQVSGASGTSANLCPLGQRFARRFVRQTKQSFVVGQSPKPKSKIPNPFSEKKEKIVYQSLPEWVLLGQLPMMTKRGHFIINGSPRVIVHQVVRSPGIYFQKLLKKDDQNKARFYGDIIPLKGVWIRLQMTKKGRVEAKFKKGKKIEVELLQKCLQVLENQTLSPSSATFNKSIHFSYANDRVATCVNGLTLHRSWSDNAFYKSLTNRRLVLPPAYKSLICKSFARKHTVQSSNQTKTKDILNKDARFLLYDEYSTLFDKKKNRAESKAEYDAFIHTYDKLYRTTQDKELEEWQKKKRNQNFFKSSSSLSALESSVEKTRLSAQQKSSSKSKTYPSKQFCNSFIVPFETNLKSEGFYPEEKEQSQKSFCKASKENNKKMFSDAHSPYVRKPCCIYTQNEALQENKDRIKGGTYSYTVNGKRNQALFPAHDQWSAPFSSPENAFKRKKCSENLFSTFKLQSRYDLGLLGREKINNKFGLLRNRSFLGQRNILASGLRFGIRDLGFGAKPYKCKSLICKKICNRSRTSANLLQIKDLYGKATCSFGAKICNRNRTNQRLVAEAPARSNFFFQTKKKTSKRVKFSGYQNTLFTDNGTTQLTAFDLCSATLWLYKLRKGEQSTDDIDHSQNRRVRTSGDLLQTQFENGVSRLKNLLSTKLQEWRGDLNNSTFSAIFKSSWKTRYTSSTYFKGAKKAELSYVDKKALLTTLSNCSILTSDVDLRFKSVCADKSSCKARRSIRKTICTCAEKVATTQSNNRFLKDQSNTISHKFLAKELFTTKPITGALREFFGSNPLSQYMDQTNPLAEITHKRRISSLGTGGVSRESAGMAIRGIHPTHYGRICPIETPEGKNAGLVNSLAFYTKIDRDGFLRTPYYRVFKGQIQSSLGFAFCSAKEESVTGLQIAPSDLQKSSNNILRTRFSTPESVPVRVADNLLDVFKKENPYKVQLIAISPIQMISVATSLIPFLEHNDANRALMGSNMQRQAVPLMLSERPVVGTGLESIVIVESGHITESQISGFASHVTANRIVIDRLSYKKKEGPFCMSTSLSYFFENKIGNGAFAPNPKSQIPNPKVLVKSSCKSLPFGAKICKKPGTSKIEDFKGQRFALVRRKALDKSLLYKATSRKRSLARIIDKNLGEVIAYGDGLQSFTFSTSLSNRRFVYMCKSWCRVTRHQKIGKIYAYQTSERLKKARAIGRLRLDSQDLLDVANSKSKALLASSWADASQNKTSKRYSVLHVQKKGLYFLKSFFMLRRVERASIKGRYIQKQSCLLSAVSLLTTFSRSNQNTCITEKPLIKEFDWVQKGDILSDCSASNKGELAVGKNVLLAYIPWEGYNFEDAIVISERLVKEHVYTSLHIERYVFQAQDLKDGNEWFTNQLPGIEPHSIQHLEESGLPKVGSFLKEGDIIVGKIRYLNKKPSSPYERLLCDILGEKNFAARNKSLYVPKGVEARVIYHKVVSIFDNDLENKVRPLEAPKTVHVFLGEKRVIQVGDKISGRHGNKGVISTILPRQDMPYLPDGTPIDIILNPLGVPSRMNVGQVLECLLGLAATYLNQNFKITAFDEKYGVEASKSIVFLKLYQARLQSGQNWLFQVAFPGKTRLVDGRSGECFDQWITVGRAYILKLIHMVSEKIHARSTGPYALITQQPLRGRSNKGGQRLGEMEVWALEGFGAAYTLQELLTKKSDDFFGRKQIVDSILPNPTSIVDTLKPSNRIDQNRSVLGHPEIFKVLLCELQALCLDLGVYIVTPDSFQRSFLGIIH